MRVRVARAMAPLAVLGLAACASVYSSRGADGLPAAQLGILQHDYAYDSGIVVEQVDGRWRGVGVIKTYRLTPGVHSLGVRANVPSHHSLRQVRWFEVKPGRVYTIQAATDPNGGRWAFWIIDRATGERVDFAR